MARTKKKEVEEEINVEDLDFSEYGVTTDEYLNISVINQKVNLKKLKRRLKNITESMAVTETSLVQLICVLENCYTAKKISLPNQEKIVILLKNFDDSLIDIVWNIDNIIDDADYGTLFEADCEMAEQKIIDDALKNRIIEFESGSAVLTDAGQKILDEMAVALNKVGGKKVKIVGHTDSSGDATKNLKLSQDRALAVKNYLISKSIPADHLSAEGLGSSKPVADNTSPEGRKKNRRIEFTVL